MDYSLKLVAEALTVICASYEEQQNIINDPKSPIDEVFDFIVLDSLDYLVETNQISQSISGDIRALYREADETLQIFNWKQEDKFLEFDPELVKQWKERAAMLLQSICGYEEQCAKAAILIDKGNY